MGIVFPPELIHIGRPVVQQDNDYRQATMLVDQTHTELSDSLQEGDIVEYRYYYHTCITNLPADSHTHTHLPIVTGIVAYSFVR